MKQISKVILSFIMLLSYSSNLMNAKAEEEIPNTLEEETIEEEPKEEIEPIIEDTLPKYIDRFVDWIDEDIYPDLLRNQSGNVYVEMKVKDASYEGMEAVLPKTIYGWINGEIQPIDVIGWN